VDADAGILDAALRAVESRQFHHAIDTLDHTPMNSMTKGW
jgi:hypothetical protein